MTLFAAVNTVKFFGSLFILILAAIIGIAAIVIALALVLTVAFMILAGITWVTCQLTDLIFRTNTMAWYWRQVENYKKWEEARKEKIRQALTKTEDDKKAALEWLTNCKVEKGCQVCGEKDGRCLDYYPICQSATTLTARYENPEQAKLFTNMCAVYCSNCMRKNGT